MKRFRIRPKNSHGVLLWGLQYDKGRDAPMRFIAMGRECGRMMDRAVRMIDNRNRRHVSISAGDKAQNLKPFYPEH